MKVEFKEWKTPFVDEQLVLFNLRWAHGEVRYGETVVRKPRDDVSAALEVEVFAIESQSTFKISFPSVLGFKVLDEMDFATGSISGPGSTFLVKNNNDPLTTHNLGDDGLWNYLIATDNECLEVAVASSHDTPIVESVKVMDQGN